MNIYTPDELVRIELLGYEQTEGLHLVERSWQNLAKKLLQDVKELEVLVEKHNSKLGYTANKCFICQESGFLARKFPEPFKS
jgi:hypothetical protein